jgi:Cys-rich protein (TIGR01571 family)
MSMAGILSYSKALILYSLVYLLPVSAVILVAVLAPRNRAEANSFSIPIVLCAIVIWGSVISGKFMCTWGRGQLRRRYRIPGDRSSDCWAHSTHHVAAIAQEARQVEA